MRKIRIFLIILLPVFFFCVLPLSAEDEVSFQDFQEDTSQTTDVQKSGNEDTINEYLSRHYLEMAGPRQEEDSEKLPQPKSAVESKQKETVAGVPEWLKRTNYGITIETGQKPRIYVETVQPLYQSLDKQDTFFTHDRVSIQEERGTYSFGLGYRRLFFDNSLLGGINTFFDYQDLHRHYRQGVGFEALSRFFEGRANAYFALSPTRRIEEDSVSYIYERAANGGDVEIGSAIPYVPWAKVFCSYYQYEFNNFDDMRGWKIRTELKPAPYLTFNLETYDDNKGKREYRMDGRFCLRVDDFTLKSILSALRFSERAYPDPDLVKRTLDRVERSFNIQLEKWNVSKVSGAIVEIRRGN